jgi:hypothetical protein
VHLPFQLLIHLGEQGLRIFMPVGFMDFQLAAQGVRLKRPLDEIEPRLDSLLLGGVQLLCLGQNMFSDTDFAEVVQHDGVADLFDLVGAEQDVR